MVLTLAACGKTEITMQEIYDASKTEALLKNHEGVYIRNEMDGGFWLETYLTKDYAYMQSRFIPMPLAQWHMTPSQIPIPILQST